MTGLTVRQQMAKGSKWKVKTAFQAENHNGAKFTKVPNPQPHYPGGYDVIQSYHHMTNFTVGEVFEVTDKSSNHPPHYYSDAKGVFIPIKIPGRGEGTFKLTELQDFVELEEAVEQLIYVFYSPSMGKYIQEIPWTSWGDRAANFDAAQKSGGVLYADKLTKAMKKKRSQDAKQFLLSHSGYYDGIDTSDIYYVFEPGGKKVDFPDDLEVQTIDKATKLMKESYLAKDYLAGAFRLRPLTLKYGSAIRAVFKDMEAKGKDYTTLLMFQDTDEDVNEYDKSKPIAELKEEFKAQKLKKDTYIMKSDLRTVAFAFKNRNDAILFKLQYAGGLESRMVDSETLDEVKAAA